MGFRLWALCLAACFLGAGCAGPRRTFVSEETTTEAKRSQSPMATQDSESNSPKVEANPVKPSVWSQWMGAFTKSPEGKAPSKPIERIPLPRTDREIPADDADSPVVPEYGSQF